MMACKSFLKLPSSKAPNVHMKSSQTCLVYFDGDGRTLIYLRVFKFQFLNADILPLPWISTSQGDVILLVGSPSDESSFGGWLQQAAFPPKECPPVAANAAASPWGTQSSDLMYVYLAVGLNSQCCQCYLNTCASITYKQELFLLILCCNIKE